MNASSGVFFCTTVLLGADFSFFPPLLSPMMPCASPHLIFSVFLCIRLRARCGAQSVAQRSSCLPVNCSASSRMPLPFGSLRREVALEGDVPLFYCASRVVFLFKKK
eukprot:RCo017730